MKEKKIIEFPNQPPFYDFLKILEKAYKENRIRNFICIYNFAYEIGKEVPGFRSGVDHYWFGEDSTIALLGLTDVMKDEILIYMKEKCDQRKETEEE